MQERLSSKLDEAGMIGVRVAMDNAPFRTGRLRSSIQYRREGNRVIIVATAPYAKYQKPGYLLAGLRESVKSFTD